MYKGCNHITLTFEDIKKIFNLPNNTISKYVEADNLGDEVTFYFNFRPKEDESTQHTE